MTSRRPSSMKGASTIHKTPLNKLALNLHPVLQTQAKYHWDLPEYQKQYMVPFDAKVDPHNISDSQGHLVSPNIVFHDKRQKNTSEAEFLYRVRQEKYSKSIKTMKSPNNSSISSSRQNEKEKKYAELKSLKLDPTLTIQERNRIKRHLYHKLEHRRLELNHERNKAFSQASQLLSECIQTSDDHIQAKIDPIGFALRKKCSWMFFRDIYEQKITVNEIKSFVQRDSINA